MSQISNSNPSTTRLDEVLARARERCLIASTQKDSENPTPNSTTGNPNPTKLESIYDVIERSLGYGIEPPVFRGKSRPPMETYTVTATEGGSVHRATNEYVLWYGQTFGFDKTPDRSGPRPPCRSNQTVGGKIDF